MLSGRYTLFSSFVRLEVDLTAQIATVPPMAYENEEISDVRQYSEQFRDRIQGAQLKHLFNYLPGIYFVAKDRFGRVVMANETAVRVCGFQSEEELLGKTDYDLFSPDRADAYVKDDRHVFETGDSMVDRVELAPDPNNSINWYLTTKIPLFGEDGDIIGLACMARNMADAPNMLRPYMELNEVLEYVREHYAEPIKIDQLAEIMHLSTSQFERRFRKAFQISPTRHILNVRIRAACNLLTTTNDTVASIALESGFYDQSHFIRGFKKITGLSPGEYRKQGCRNPW